MGEQLKVYIAGLGAITAVGLDAKMTYASVKARINRYKDTGYSDNKKNPVKMALVPEDALTDLPAPSQVYSRWEQQLFQLSLAAVSEAFENFETDQSIPLILSCPECYSQWPYQLPDDFLESFIEQSAAPINLELSRVIQTGRSGTLDALEVAYKYFLDSNIESILLGGVDSCQRTELLQGLLDEDRISTLDTNNGFTPGEGAGFILLTRNKAKALQGETCVVSIAAPGLAQESGHLYSELPYLGEGLASAIKQSLSNFDGADIQRIYSSMNGERFWVKELSVGLIRNQQHLHEKYQIEHPADCYGDIGAASGAVLIGLATQHLFKQTTATSHMVCCASDHGFRSAVTIKMEPKIKEANFLSKAFPAGEIDTDNNNGDQHQQNNQQEES